MRRKKLIRIPVFFLVTLLAIAGIQNLFCIRDYKIYSWERGFKQEKKNSLDAVYIGASHVFSFYEPPLAWEHYGLAVIDYAIPSMPLASVKYRIKEAVKTQPDALYIINLNCFKTSKVYNQNLHRSLDYMPWSLNKLQMMFTLFKKAGYRGSRVMEYFMPIIRFHSGWSELKSKDYYHPVNGMKGAYTHKPFMSTVTDMTGRFSYTDERGELTADQVEALEDILSYCDEKKLKVLFVMVPQMLDETILSQINTIKDTVAERGYDVLDLRDRMAEMQIRPEEDFHNENHLNIHGAIKFTDYLAKYLKEHYGFEDKRGKAGWESWDASVSRYKDLIGAYSIDVEQSLEARDYALTAPALSADTSAAHTLTLQWNEIPGADGYAVYCKTPVLQGGIWTETARTEAEETSFVHEGLDAGVTYTYTVVPFRKDGEKLMYGSFDPAGIQAVVTGGSPEDGEGVQAGAGEDMDAAVEEEEDEL